MVKFVSVLSETNFALREHSRSFHNNNNFKSLYIYIYMKKKMSKTIFNGILSQYQTAIQNTRST